MSSLFQEMMSYIRHAGSKYCSSCGLWVPPPGLAMFIFQCQLYKYWTIHRETKWWLIQATVQYTHLVQYLYLYCTVHIIIYPSARRRHTFALQTDRRRCIWLSTRKVLEKSYYPVATVQYRYLYLSFVQYSTVLVLYLLLKRRYVELGCRNLFINGRVDPVPFFWNDCNNANA